VNLILTAVFATIAGLGWNWATGNAPMSYWLMGSFFVGSCLLADSVEWVWDCRAERRRRDRRVAVSASWRGERRTR
jgi:hypothetical protein